MSHRLARLADQLGTLQPTIGGNPLALAPAAGGKLPGMNMWFDIMRDMEHLMDDYEKIFDAWEAGGVDGMVIGPLTFDTPDLIKTHLHSSGHMAQAKDRAPTDTYDPDPAVYAKFGVDMPPAVQNAPYSATSQTGDAIKTTREERPEARKLLTDMLTDAKRRGFTIMIFQAQSGAGSDSDGPAAHHLFDRKSLLATCARIVDTMQHYPMVDGVNKGGQRHIRG